MEQTMEFIVLSNFRDLQKDLEEDRRFYLDGLDSVWEECHHLDQPEESSSQYESHALFDYMEYVTSH